MEPDLRMIWRADKLRRWELERPHEEMDLRPSTTQGVTSPDEFPRDAGHRRALHSAREKHLIFQGIRLLYSLQSAV